MENLPEELILMIFSYIRPLELNLVTSKVCKKWNNLISSRIIRIQCDEHYNKLHEGLQVILVTNADQTVYQETLVSYAVRLTPRLRELTINCDFPLDKNSFKALSALVHLRHLDVFAKKQILNLDTHINPGLTSMVANETMSNGFFGTLKRCKLSSFHMYGRADHYMPKEMESFLHVQSVHLRDLTLRCSEMSDSRFKVLTQCVNLLSLQLYMCSMLTKIGIMFIVSLPQLKRLHITGTTLLRTKGIMELVKRLPPRLCELNLSASQFGAEHCDMLVLRLPGLRALELWRTRLERPALLRLALRLRRLRALDCDAELRAAHIIMLERHSALRKLRCQWLGMISTSLELTSSLQVFAGRFLRSSTEGPSAELFYFWTRDGAPLPSPAPADPLLGDEPVVTLTHLHRDLHEHD